jgi:uncharacterized repeat protein (TIGR01451 family)
MKAIFRVARVALAASLCVSCATTAFAGQGALVLEANDNHAYARYGQTLAYVVTLTNNGTGTATDVAVAAVLSPAWDAPGAGWTCYPGTDGASGSGPLDDVATLPPGARVTWVLELPVRIDAADVTATLDVTATGATPVADTNELVIFKEGFDVPYGDGTQGTSEIAGVPLPSD